MSGNEALDHLTGDLGGRGAVFDKAEKFKFGREAKGGAFLPDLGKHIAEAFNYHISFGQQVAEVDVVKAGEAVPEDFVAGWRNAGAGEMVAELCGLEGGGDGAGPLPAVNSIAAGMREADATLFE